MKGSTPETGNTIHGGLIGKYLPWWILLQKQAIQYRYDYLDSTYLRGYYSRNREYYLHSSFDGGYYSRNREYYTLYRYDYLDSTDLKGINPEI